MAQLSLVVPTSETIQRFSRYSQLIACVIGDLGMPTDVNLPGRQATIWLSKLLDSMSRRVTGFEKGSCSGRRLGNTKRWKHILHHRVRPSSIWVPRSIGLEGVSCQLLEVEVGVGVTPIFEEQGVEVDHLASNKRLQHPSRAIKLQEVVLDDGAGPAEAHSRVLA